jgi:hypothetical protein
MKLGCKITLPSNNPEERLCVKITCIHFYFPPHPNEDIPLKSFAIENTAINKGDML